MEKKTSIILPLEAISKLTQIDNDNFELTTQYINNELKHIKGFNFWEDVQKQINHLKQGEETSLKRLVGKEIWLQIHDNTFKRMLGKVFKSNIGIRIFKLKIGRIKSNNEQQYIKI